MSFPSRVGIIGLGLIGGSLGLALKGVGTRVVGVDQDAETAESALALGCVDELAHITDLGEFELVVMCVPPAAVGRVALELATTYPGDGVLTDATSVKGEVLAAFERMPNPKRCVGGHPMAGLERTGHEHARADLYQGARWILTPIPETDPSALELVREMVSRVGATPIEMSPDVHDREVSYLSHLPHAIAASLMHLQQDLGYPEAAGGSWRDATRVGGVDPDLWAQILMANRQEAAKAISAFDHAITALRHALVTGDEEAVRRFFQEARMVKEGRPDA